MRRFVLKVGGSLMNTPGGLQVDFLRMLRDALVVHIQLGAQFFCVVGGGAAVRVYQDAARTLVPHISTQALDDIGIYGTRFNAQLMRALFHTYAAPYIIEDYDVLVDHEQWPVIVGSGWKSNTGHSTNACAVKLAIDYNIETIINLSNRPYVYDKDPSTHSDAVPLKNLSWDEYLSLIPATWTAGAHVPIDAFAAKLAKEHHKKLIYTDGTRIETLKNILGGNDFEATVIS